MTKNPDDTEISADALARLPTNAEVLSEALKDPAFRAHWESTALARAVAIQLLQYRADHGLTQTKLGRALGMHQPAIARLESVEHNPSIDTLKRLSRELEIEFHYKIDITPTGVALTA